MKVKVTNVKFKAGTRVRISVSKDDLDDAKQLFNRYRKGVKNEYEYNGNRILSEKERGIYLHGVRVQSFSDDDPSIFSYDLTSIKLNRDRTIFDLDEVRSEIVDLYQFIKDKKVIRKFLQGYIQDKDDLRTFETNMGYIFPQYTDEWLDVVHKEFGKFIVVKTNGISADLARDKGYTVIESHYYARELLTKIGIQEDHEVLDDGWEYIFADITEEERGILGEIKAKAEEVTGVEDDGYAVKVFVRQHQDEEMSIDEEIKAIINGRTMRDGYFNSARNEVGIRRSILQDKWIALKVFMHELAHKKNDNRDCTRDFEHDIFDILIGVLKKQEGNGGKTLNYNIVGDKPMETKKINGMEFQRGHDGDVWVRSKWIALGDLVETVTG